MNTIAPTELNPSLAVINGVIKTTSLKVAEHFGKRHDNVIKAIQKLDCSPEFSALHLEVAEYIDDQGKKRLSYEISRDGFMFLAMGFTGKEAAKWKEAYINAFNAMAEQLQSQPSPDALLHVTPLELAALVDQRVNAVAGEVMPRQDCPQYGAPKSALKVANRVGLNAWLTYPELKEQYCTLKLLHQLKQDGHDVEGAIAEFSGMWVLLDDFYRKLGAVKAILDNLDRRGLNIYPL